MSKPSLILLTNSFPILKAKGESWLADELMLSHHFYENINIFPDQSGSELIDIPSNCNVFFIKKENLKLSIKDYISVFQVVLSDFWPLFCKKIFFKELRYNLSLVKNLYVKAKLIRQKKELFSSKTIVYAYWADNLATTACLIKKIKNDVKVITRGHGFEIFEEQTKNHIIPFRNFQNKYLDNLFTDSKIGCAHLKKTHPGFKKKYSFSYVGTMDSGIGPFNSDMHFTVATCSFIRNVKRLELMADILKHIDFKIVWHVLGDGEDMEQLKQKNKTLKENIEIKYHGILTNQEIINFYKSNAVNLFVSLSSSEGLPVSMMEAQSFGIPILATDVGGCNEIVTPHTGILIPKEFNPQAVAEKITNFKDSKMNMPEFRMGIRQFWEENFSAERNYQNFVEEILKI